MEDWRKIICGAPGLVLDEGTDKSEGQSHMVATVGSLEDMCLDLLSDDLTPLWARSSESDDLVWIDPDLVLHSELAEKLLQKLSEKGKLNDRMLSMFQVERTFLKHVRTLDMSKLTLNALGVMETHRLVSLTIDIKSLYSMDAVLSCMRSANWAGLRKLRCTNACHGSNPTLKLLPETESLKNLRFLSFENVKLSNASLVIIANSLPNIRLLDISRNYTISDISPLKRQDQLEALIMCDIDGLAEGSTVTTLHALKNLEHLDLSSQSQKYTGGIMTALMCRPSSNPNLTSLDLSGRGAAPEEMIRAYLDKHPSLRFLGLCFNQACDYSLFDVRSSECRRGIDVAGTSNLDQIAYSLKHYRSRDDFILKVLLRLGDELFIDKGRSLTTDNDKIITALMEVSQPHPDPDNDAWVFLKESMECLTVLLRDRRVFHIEPDTVNQLLRTCHHILKRSPQCEFHLSKCYKRNSEYVTEFATEILKMYANFGTGTVLQRAEFPPTALRQGHKVFILDS